MLSPNSLNDFLTNLAAELTVKFIELTAGRLKGDPERQALHRVYRQAFEGMLAPFAALDEDNQRLLADIMQGFVMSPGVAQRLLDLAILKEAPPLGELRVAFEVLGYDPATLEVGFDDLLAALMKALEDAIREEAGRDGSPLTNRLVARSLTGLLDELRQTRQDILDAIQQGQEELRRLFGRLGIQVGDLTNVQGVAIGENNTVNHITNHYGLTFGQVLEIIKALNPAAYAQLKDDGPVVVSERARPLSDAMQALLDAVLSDDTILALNDAQTQAILAEKPVNLTEYRLARIVEWSQQRYRLDRRFVQLTLLIDQGEEAQQRWATPESIRRFTDLRDVMSELNDSPALVLLGAPGSGKSTLLRRLQLDDAIDRLREGDSQRISFFISLNGYRPKTPGGPLPSPYDWLVENWMERYPSLPSLGDLLSGGRMLLLLDALNEIPHKSAQEYAERVGLWQRSIVEHIGDGRGNRALFSCRSLDYSSSLSSPELRVPQVVVQPVSPEQVQQFLRVYLPARADVIWAELEDSPQFDLFRTPYFLKLLVDQVESAGDIPKGRAGLFTGFVRKTRILSKKEGTGVYW
jgi:hypothetical protein